MHLSAHFTAVEFVLGRFEILPPWPRLYSCIPDMHNLDSSNVTSAPGTMLVQSQMSCSDAYSLRRRNGSTFLLKHCIVLEAAVTLDSCEEAIL